MNKVESQLKLEEKVEAVIEQLRPMIARHDGDVRLVEITKDGVAKIEFLGSCVDCSIADITLNDGLKTSIMLACDEITDVVLAK